MNDWDIEKVEYKNNEINGRRVARTIKGLMKEKGLSGICESITQVNIFFQILMYESETMAWKERHY